MSDFTPTPGPWSPQDDDKAILIVAQNGAHIGEVCNDDDDEETGESNARLVCASPDLFARLEALVVACIPGGGRLREEALRREVARARKLIHQIRTG